MPILQPGDREALRTAWRRVVRLWRPMAGWTLLAWSVVAVLLGPLSSILLGWQILRGPRAVVGNEALLVWLLTPRGALWALLAGGLGIMGGLLRYAGLFHIVSDDMAGRRATVRRTALHMVPELPALFRLALAGVAAGGVLAAVLLAGLAGIRAAFISAHDINYYLAERPSEWRVALWGAGAWAVVWALGAAFVLGRLVLSLPAYVDGHRPFRMALRRARERGLGRKPRLFRLLALSVGVWAAVRLTATGIYVAAGAAAVGWVASASTSLRTVVLATGVYGAGLFAVDAIVAFLGFALVATVLTKFYHEDTLLHEAAPPLLALRELPWTVMMRARPWLRPRRLVPAAGLLALTGVVASGLLLDRIPDLKPVTIVAHRAGPPPAPENTLAALERAIAAGADYSEIDVQRTRDGTVVVVHDADLMRVAGDRRRIAAVTYEEIADLVQLPDDGSPGPERRVATLDDLLARARGRIGVAIELKYYGPDPGLAPAVVRAVRSAGMADQVVLMSLNLAAVEQVASSAPDLILGYLSAASVGDIVALPVRFVAVARPAVNRRLLRSARDRGVEVHVWTVNRASVMAELMERGVDGIITDDPALAARVRAELLELSPAGRLLLRVRPGVRGDGVLRGAGGDAIHR